MLGKLDIQSLAPLISWPHFFYTWNVKDNTSEADNLRCEAEAFLDKYKEKCNVNYMIHTYDVVHDGDDIIIKTDAHSNVRIPFLRQQIPNLEGYCLCISDFIGEQVSLFATSVEPIMIDENIDDVYYSLLAQTLSDRMAEAAAEKIAAGVRPAVGYPSIPDMSINFILDQLMDFSKIGVQLTDSGMMMPHASVSGFVLNHPKAQYFSVGDISEEQLLDYSQRRGYTYEQTKRFIHA